MNPCSQSTLLNILYDQANVTIFTYYIGEHRGEICDAFSCLLLFASELDLLI